MWCVCHPRADSVVWLSHTSSIWPWSGAPKVPLYSTFLGGLRQAITQRWTKSPTSGSWYKYDNKNVDLVKFVKGNTNSILMDFQKNTSILFYIDVRYVSVHYINLRNDYEVIDCTGHNPPPIIIQLQDTTLSLSSSNTLSLCWATPHHHCRATTHPDLWQLLGQKLTWTMIFSFRLHLNQQKNARATQVKIKCQIYFILLRLGYGYNVRKLLQ